MNYVDGYLLVVPRKKLGLYRKMARFGVRLWMKHGALDINECVSDDLKVPWGTPFPKLLKLKAGETVFFSWIVYKSRAHRDKVNAAVMKDPAMAKMDPSKMPMDPKRMSVGGFKVFVAAK